MRFFDRLKWYNWLIRQLVRILLLNPPGVIPHGLHCQLFKMTGQSSVSLCCYWQVCHLSSDTRFLSLFTLSRKKIESRQPSYCRNGNHLHETGAGTQTGSRALRVSNVQDSGARRHALHHRPLHQLRDDHRAGHAQATSSLDQERRCLILRPGLLNTFITLGVTALGFSIAAWAGCISFVIYRLQLFERTCADQGCWLFRFYSSPRSLLCQFQQRSCKVGLPLGRSIIFIQNINVLWFNKVLNIFFWFFPPRFNWITNNNITI